MRTDLRDLIGNRGETIIELCLTEYKDFGDSLFRLGFLGDKWPSVDYYVELKAVSERRPYFFVQAKATAAGLSTSLVISTRKNDIKELLQIPGPTYIFGIHEPSKRVFVRSVHLGTPLKAITRIPLSHELTIANLKVLHDEVREFWGSDSHKPNTSAFA